MAVSLGYTLELIFGILSCLLLWLLFGSQILVYRFTPPKKRIALKMGLILFGVIALVIQSVRQIDLSGIYGIFNLPIQDSLHAQVIGLLLDAAILVLYNITRSLYAQIQKSLPWYYLMICTTPLVLYHIALVVLGIEENTYQKRAHNEGGFEHELGTIVFIRHIMFNCLTLLFLVFNNAIFYQLYQQVKKFMLLMEQEDGVRIEKGKNNSDAANAGVGNGTNGVGLTMAQQQLQQQQMRITEQQTKLIQVQSQQQSSHQLLQQQSSPRATTPRSSQLTLDPITLESTSYEIQVRRASNMRHSPHHAPSRIDVIDEPLLKAQHGGGSDGMGDSIMRREPSPSNSESEDEDSIDHSSKYRPPTVRSTEESHHEESYMTEESQVRSQPQSKRFDRQHSTSSNNNGNHNTSSTAHHHLKYEPFSTNIHPQSMASAAVPIAAAAASPSVFDSHEHNNGATDTSQNTPIYLPTPISTPARKFGGNNGVGMTTANHHNNIYNGNNTYRTHENGIYTSITLPSSTADTDTSVSMDNSMNGVSASSSNASTIGGSNSNSTSISLNNLSPPHKIQSNSAPSRTSALRTALTKMLQFVLFTSLIILGSIAADIPSCVRYLRNDIDQEEFSEPQPEDYHFIHNITVWFQQVALVVVVWYAWIPIDVYTSAQVRLEKHTPFWHTLKHGLPKVERINTNTRSNTAATNANPLKTPTRPR